MNVVLGTATDAAAIEAGVKDADVIIDAVHCDTNGLMVSGENTIQRVSEGDRLDSIWRTQWIPPVVPAIEIPEAWPREPEIQRWSTF